MVLSTAIPGAKNAKQAKSERTRFGKTLTLPVRLPLSATFLVFAGFAYFAVLTAFSRMIGLCFHLPK